MFFLRRPTSVSKRVEAETRRQKNPSAYQQHTYQEFDQLDYPQYSAREFSASLYFVIHLSLSLSLSLS